MNRRQFIQGGIALSGLLVSGNATRAEERVVRVKDYTSNPRLRTIAPGWKGTPLDQEGRFMNHEHPWLPDYGQIMKFMVTPNPQRRTKMADAWRIAVLKDGRWLDDPSDKIVWLGHASFFLQMSGKRILIDPVFGKLPVGKRFSELPVSPERLLGVDYVLVSHAHYDHCDKAAIELLTRNNPKVEILTGLGLDRVIRKWTDRPIHTAGWFQQYDLKNDLQITFLPSRHWANRSPFDVNTSLWGGFMIQHGGKCVYYGGDSGYGSHFKEIGRLFPKIDAALIGAGAYAPTWFMGPNHQDPFGALQAFRDTNAETFIPFHYGTFDSADEPLSEPEQIFRTMNAEGRIGNRLKTLQLGETFLV